MYPSQWHRIYGDQTGESARRILLPLLERFDVSSMVEVGCGHGHWSRVALEHGIDEILAIDGPWNEQSKLLIDAGNYREADLGQPLDLGRRFDLAVCLEVAEHVAAEGAGNLVASLVKAADVILFGAAIPMQGGHGHINEQWPSYWRALFEPHGYEPFDLVRPVHWEDREVHYWYRQNAFVYVNRAAPLAIERAGLGASGGDLVPSTRGLLAPMDAVHPEKYEEVASYKSIAFKRLARNFPAWAARRLKSKLTGEG
ncbi:methyltransferase domain-containing protein [Altererythrobacter sp. MF3-039]|uniref:methyltransferase domain-containing protein n=1 Tax=Altererythrobacter sp. MF3-039 TaxID=3252901 RepID=UPI00390CAC4A